MNREIKFKAYLKTLKLVRPVVYFDFDNEELGCYLVDSSEGDMTIFSFDEVELMQYTGLKDKNGVEIYECYVVVQDCYMWFSENQPNYVGTVEWVYSQWQVIAHCVNPNRRGISDGVNKGLNDDGFDENTTSDWRVLGNIYENPELLEVLNK